jgi:hypothetical protein
VGDAWEWRPPIRYRYVYSVHDCVPDEFFGAYVDRVVRRIVAPGGLLILGRMGATVAELSQSILRRVLLTLVMCHLGKRLLEHRPCQDLLGLLPNTYLVSWLRLPT